MNFDKDIPLSQIRGETIKAHNALMDYFLMGGGRSFSKLFEQWERIKKATEPYPKEPPTKRLQTLKDWSVKFHWKARIIRQVEIDNEIALEQYRQRHMSKAEALALLADQARGNMADFADVESPADLVEYENAALVKNITHHYTQNNRGDKEERTIRFTLGLYCAQKALELILKHHGAFAADNKQQNLNIDIDLSDLTDNQLKRLAAGEDIAAILADE
jgi:hypothetical protein